MDGVLTYRQMFLPPLKY